MAPHLIAFLVFSAIARSGLAGEDNTFISNESKWTIVASTTYTPFGTGISEFTNRVIRHGQFDCDTYTRYVDECNIELWIQGADYHNHVEVPGDRSIVAYNNADGTGADIYLARYGTRVKIDDNYSHVLTTLWP
ncbi:hypothetical protein Mapa_013956 [Marchantia paleacea]|nr:hypothetical protein Mapa_013956 [Marchantia paleacea]